MRKRKSYPQVVYGPHPANGTQKARKTMRRMSESVASLQRLSIAFVAVTIVVAQALLPQPVSAQLNQPLHRDGWILAAAHAPGLQGAIWRSDVWIFTQEYSVSTVTLRFCRAERDNTSVEEYTVTTSGGQRVYHFEDVVDHFLDVGDGSWVGAIHYTADSDVQVWARVYSISADGSRSFGQLVEGIASDAMSPDGNPWISDEHQRMIPTKHTADDRFRVNVGIVNPTATENEYYVSIYDRSGSRRDSLTVTVQPYSLLQLSDPFAAVDGGEWSGYAIRVVCATEGGGTLAYVSVVDNTTNDAYFVRGTKQLPIEEGAVNCTRHDDGWVLAAAHAPGLEDSIWRTDLWIRADSPYDTAATLYFCRQDEDCTGAEGHEVSFTENEKTAYFEDVVDQFLGVGGGSWVGAIHYNSSTTDVQVWARVYSISPDGTASYGQLIEGIPTADMSPDRNPWDNREQQYIFAAKHTADDRYRVNIGIVNPTSIDSEYEISAYDSTGNCPPGGCLHMDVNVPAYSMTQLSDPLASWQGGDWSEAHLQIKCNTEDGGTFAYASVVDNATNDAFFVRGIKLLRPSQ